MLNFDGVNFFVFDFDSTIVSIEILDAIIKNKITNEEMAQKVDSITKKAMNGEIDFYESITQRFYGVKLTHDDFLWGAQIATDSITDGIKEVIDFLQKKNQKIFILSGGFRTTILPVAEKLGIPLENCFANDYTSLKLDTFTASLPSDTYARCNCGTEEESTRENASPARTVTLVTLALVESPLLHEGGKNEIIKQLKKQSRLEGKIIMLGDGMSDCKVWLDGDADYFIGCGFNVIREKVKQNSDFFVTTTLELLKLFHQH